MAHYGSIDIQKGLLAASLINIVVLVATFTLQIIPNFIDISKPIDDYYGKVVNSVAKDINDEEFYRVETYRYTTSIT